jgi:hypothetical protein
MNAWIRADADFGAPLLTLTLDARSRLGQEFHQLLKDKHPRDTSVNAEFAATITRFLEQKRPDLAGLILIGVRFSSHILRHEFTIIHKSAKVSMIGEAPPTQRLELCWICGKPLGGDDFAFRHSRIVSDGRCEEVCSEECVTASEILAAYEKHQIDVNNTKSMDGLTDRQLSPQEWAGKSREELTTTREEIRARMGITDRRVTDETRCGTQWVAEYITSSGQRSPRPQTCIMSKNHTGQCRSMTGVVRSIQSIYVPQSSMPALTQSEASELEDTSFAHLAGKDKNFLISTVKELLIARCSVCNYELAADEGSVGDRCSLHKA